MPWKAVEGRAGRRQAPFDRLRARWHEDTKPWAPCGASAIALAMPATPAWPPASTPRLFVDQPLGADTAPTVEGAAAHYLLHVMRAKPGDPLLLFDNRSGEWLATVTDAGKRALTLRRSEARRDRGAVPALWL